MIEYMRDNPHLVICCVTEASANLVADDVLALLVPSNDLPYNWVSAFWNFAKYF